MKFGDIAVAGFCVQALDVAPFADGQRRVDEDFQELVRPHHFAGHAAFGYERGNEGCDNDHSGIDEQFRRFGGAADVFDPVGVRKTQIPV